MSRKLNADRPKLLLVDTVSSSNDYCVELSSALKPFFELTVFTVRGTRIRPSDCDRLIIAFAEYWGNRSKLAKLLTQLRATVLLAQQLWIHRHGAVHVQFFRSTVLELPLYLLMRPLLRRLVYSVHNVLPHEPRQWHRAVYRLWYLMPDVLHVLSHHTAERLVNEFGVRRARIFYAPHGNYARFMHETPARDAVETKRRLGLPPDGCLVLYYGLIRPYKGVDRLVEAAAHVQSGNVYILAAGGCPVDVEQTLRTRMADLHLDGTRCQLQVGHLENQTMSDLIAAADVLVFPYHHIYQSGALLMAMTYGKAIIASDLPGFREYLSPEQTGVLCDTANPVAFGRAIDELAGHPETRARLASAAVQAALTTYSWPVIAHTLNGAYRG